MVDGVTGVSGGCSDGRKGSQAKKWKWHLETVKDKEMDSPFRSFSGISPADTLNLGEANIWTSDLQNDNI